MTRRERVARSEAAKATALEPCELCGGPRGRSRTKPRTRFCSPKCERISRTGR